MERLRREKKRRAALSVQATDRIDHIKSVPFAQQLALIEDPSRRKAGLCTRRAGKSVAAVVYLLLVALMFPRCRVAYVGITRQAAKDVVWHELEKVCRLFGIRAVFNASTLRVALPNGSEIFVVGAHNERSIETLRGKAFRLVVVDECASYGRHFEPLIHDVLRATLIDFSGTLCLTGTPGAACTGYFHDVTTKDRGFSVHRWSLVDNPHIAGARDEIALVLKENGWDESNPTFRREYLGLWAASLDLMVYKFLESRNTFTDLPGGEYGHVMGVDLGYNDAFVISVMAYSLERPESYLIDQYAQSELLPSEWSTTIEEYAERYKPQAIVVDAGGLGKAYVEEMKDKWALPVKAAEKTKKPAYIELMNGDLLSGRLKSHASITKFADQMTQLQWDEKRPGIKEHPDFPNDLCDATLYAWRECRHHMNFTKPLAPQIGSHEYTVQQAQRYREAALRRGRLGSLTEQERYLRESDAQLRRSQGPY